MDVLLITGDLMMTSTAAGAGERVGVAVRVAPPKKAVALLEEASPRLVAIDLESVRDDVTGFVATVRGACPGADVLAYGPHVYEARLEAARQAGCDPVLARGQFHRGLDVVVARYASGGD